jgi:hypothetical protein
LEVSPASPKEIASAMATITALHRQPTVDQAVAMVLEAVGGLRLDFGYINGHDVDDAHVRLDGPMFDALEALATASGQPELRDRLAHMRSPLCREWLREDAICVTAVAVHGDPCPAHHPDRAAELGRCAFPAGRRICRNPVRDGDRCRPHTGCCTARIQKTGEPCGRTSCTIARHRPTQL